MVVCDSLFKGKMFLWFATEEVLTDINVFISAALTSKHTCPVVCRVQRVEMKLRESEVRDHFNVTPQRTRDVSYQDMTERK